MGARAVATLLLMTVILSGPLQPLVFAQPAQDTTGQPTAQAPTAPPEPAAPPPLPEPPIPQPAMQPPPPPEPAMPQPAMQPPPPPEQAAPPPAMQPPPPPPAAQQPPPPPAQRREVTSESVMVTQPAPRRVGADIYSFGAGVMTVAKMPFNVGLCAIGTVVGAGLFIITLGSGYKASTRAVEEGCRGPWIVRGDDIRPDGPRRDLDYYQH